MPFVGRPSTPLRTTPRTRAPVCSPSHRPARRAPLPSSVLPPCATRWKGA